jgi:hypothetical protein
MGERARRLPTWLAVALGAAGLAVLVYLVARLGPARIGRELGQLAAILPVVLALTFAKYVMQTAGWRLLLPTSIRPPWPSSVAATITGDAIGYLTWAGPVTGEPVRALLTRHLVPMDRGVAAGAVERLMYNVTAAALVAGVLVVGALVRGHRGWAVAAALVVAASLALFFLIVRRRRDPAGTSTPSSHTTALAARVRTIAREHRAALPSLVLLELAQHAVLVLEALLMLRVLGADPTLLTALLFEAVSKLVNTAGMLVPARIGVAEGGSAWLADALGFAASFGLSLALMRRLRALIWAGVGLALLPIETAAGRSQR